MFLHAPLLEQQEAHARRRQQQQQQEAGAAADTIPVDGEPPAAGPRRIEAGDMVIVYENINSAKFVYVERDAVFRNRYGTFRHNVRLASLSVARRRRRASERASARGRRDERRNPPLPPHAHPNHLLSHQHHLTNNTQHRTGSALPLARA